jgi:exonuclease SbcC
VIREITLVDFMSHRHTVIEPAAGLTVLVGPNNSGKSAVTAALQVIAGNIQKEYAVRHGCKECSITIETNDGHTVTWRRKGKTVSYTIDGTPIHRLQGGVPDELHRVLRLAPVESVEGGDTFSVHFAPQKEPIFLLNGSGKQAAAFFASASDASRLMAMQQRHKKKTSEHASAEKRLLVEMESIKAQIENLAAVPALEQASADAAAEYQQIMEQAALMEKLTSQIRSIVEAASSLSQTEDLHSTFAALQTPPELADTTTIESAITQIAAYQGRIIALDDECNSLVNIASPPAIVDTRQLTTLCNEIASTLAVEDHAHKQIESLRELVSPPILGDEATLDRICRDAANESENIAKGEAEVATARSLQSPPELSDEKLVFAIVHQLLTAARDYEEYTEEVQTLGNLAQPPAQTDDLVLRGAIAHFETAIGAVHESQRELEEAQKAAGEAKSQIAQWATDNPTCPICGSDIGNEDSLLDHGAHRHA